MAATWCGHRGCWIVRHPQRWFDVIATGQSKTAAEDAAEERMRVERERRQ